VVSGWYVSYWLIISYADFIGNYVISGGNESVLAIWQLDTGSRQYLPHLSSTVQNIVVSPSGSSYAIQLANNSAMIISTAELVPTTNIAGIQTSVLADSTDPELKVARVEEEGWPARLIQRTPALIDPSSPSKLLLAVGRLQEIDPMKPLVTGSPYLQTFDLGTGHNSTRQVLSRANVTFNDSAPNTHAISEPRVTHIEISHNGKWMATVDEWTPPARDMAYLASDSAGAEEERLGRREIYLKFWERSEDKASWNLVSRMDAPHTISANSSRPGRILDLAVDPEHSRFVTIGEDDVVCTWTPKTRKRDNVPVYGPTGRVLHAWTCQHALSLGKLEIPEEIGHLDSPVTSASVAFSKDGSVLAAASSSHEGVVYFMEPNLGVIRKTQTGLFAGNLIKMDFLGQDLIVLANQLTVWDLVSNEVRTNIGLQKNLVKLSHAQKQEMVHLAVDAKSRSFAIALPSRSRDLHEKRKNKSLSHQQSELFIFKQDDAEPQLHEVLPTFVTALLPAVDTDGFIILDTSAEVRTVHKRGTQTFTAMAQSTTALNLEDASTQLNGVTVPEDEEEDEEPDDVQLLTPAATEDGNEVDDEHDTPVVTSQQLANVFDIGPAFALPPLEEMFYQVAGLFASKPLAQSVS
jgi:NET1-associated nuclear protein 1 (U3 small nucleolar RNA-associated protein 17)